MAPLSLLLLLLLLLLVTFPFCLPAALDPVAADEAALLALKRYIISDPSGLLSAWSTTASPHCSWRGVSCDAASGRVIALNLTGLFGGNLSPSIAGLTELRSLSLPSNSLSGEIPPALGDFRRLELLDLSNNNFSGEIPSSFTSLPSLRVLDLSSNSLSGVIPEALIGFSRLESLDLSSNRLAGSIAISSSSQCWSLVHLILSNNFLVDKIPPEIGKCSKLRTLLLNDNIFEGRIPPEIGQLSGLRVLDVSRNSLTDRIPNELGNCTKLSVFVLTDLADSPRKSSNEFNAFVGGIPWQILAIPALEVLWAPRANLDGQLPDSRRGSCKLRILNLGQNYISGWVPEWLGLCRDLFFLDLSSNNLQGLLPVRLGIQCMVYFNISRNSLAGSLLGFLEAGCSKIQSLDGKVGSPGNLVSSYSAMLLRNALIYSPLRLILDRNFVVLHDFSWNGFSGELPSIPLELDGGGNFSYGLLLNNNGFNGSFPGELFRSCVGANVFAVNLSANQLSGEIGMLSRCPQMKRLEVADNHLRGLIPPDISELQLLSYLDLRGNYLNGSIPGQLGGLKDMEEVLLGRNHLSGEIPAQLGGMASLSLLDLSRNSLAGSIPSSLTNASRLEKVLLDHNGLSGSIPPSFSRLTMLTTFDVSFNNLSGSIPYLDRIRDCDYFRGNLLLQPCMSANTSAPSSLPSHTDISKFDGGRRNRLKLFEIAAVASAAVILSALLALVLLVACGRRKLTAVTSPKRKVVVTFADAPSELNYEGVVRATGNFSIQNLIGTGGFGATYKAELVPGFLVAVKRLSIGKFQGLQQFDAEIRTLGRIRHKNLVTLIGYHMGEADTFLIYNYLCGGNLETFIHDMYQSNVKYAVVLKIALDVAQALAYLHYSCVPRIVHRDIKPSNILLDEKLNAYLSDFGLARLLEVSETHATTDVAGTFGYVAPEYATTCRVSDKADVYSFGVVLLELMSGKRSLDPSFSEFGDGFTIVAWGRLLIQEGRAGELFTPSLWDSGPKEHLVSMLRLALACTVESLSVRPSMKQVVEILKHLTN